MQLKSKCAPVEGQLIVGTLFLKAIIFEIETVLHQLLHCHSNFEAASNRVKPMMLIKVILSIQIIRFACIHTSINKSCFFLPPKKDAKKEPVFMVSMCSFA